jgi:beta-lactam-binding protein with PASTA domain
MDRDVKASWAGNPIQQLATVIADWIYSMLQPTIVTVPDVTGEVDAWARHLLRRLGLRVRAVEDIVPSDYVRATDPPAGTQAKRGTVVTMYCVPGEGAVGYA